MSASPSVINRVLAILNLFGKHKPLVTIEEISTTLGVSAASAYRYASDLTEAGMLSRTSGRYRLGPKIIELEYLIRSYDPIIQAGHDLMHGLAEMTGCTIMLCNIYDKTIVNVFQVQGKQPVAPLTYTKGLRMPLFLGAQAHIVLAHMNRRKLKRFYEAALEDPASAQSARAIGADWQAFTKALKHIRHQGYYISHDQLDAGVTGIAAPVVSGKEILGSLVLTLDTDKPAALSEETLVGLVVQTASEISRRMEPAPGQEAA